MNCRRARSALQRAADGELPLGERLEVEAHARDCERCAPLARRLTELDDAFTRFPEPPVESLDLDAQVRAVRARVEREHDAPVRVPVRRRALVLAAAAVLVAALAGLALLLRGSRPAAGPIVEDGGPAPRSIEEVVPAPIDTTDGERTVGTGATPGGLTHEVGDAPIVPQPARDAVTTLAPTPEVAPEPIDAPAPTPEDRARADAARARLATALVETAASSPADRVGLALAFERALQGLVREQWPVARMAEGLALGADAEVARAAVRFLGVRGDRGALSTLQRALEREELAQDAALALADLGEPALEALSRIVEERRFEAPVLARLSARGNAAGDGTGARGNAAGDGTGARGDAAGARVLEAIVRRARRAETNGPASGVEDAARLRSHAAFALARSGDEALDALLRLATDAVLPGGEAWSLARLVPGAGTRLAELLRSNARVLEGRGIAPAAVLRAIDALHPEGGVLWLDALARDERALRDDALTALAGYDDAEAAGTLLRWHASGRVSAELTRALFESLVARRPAAVAELARALVAARDRAQVHELFALLTAHAVSAHVPAYVELAATPLLARGDRRSAIQLAAELDAEDSAALLEALWPRLEDDERELRGACVLALHRLGGRDALARLFARAPQRALDRLIAVCDDADALARPTTTLFRVLQELDAVGSRGAP